MNDFGGFRALVSKDFRGSLTVLMEKVDFLFDFLASVFHIFARVRVPNQGWDQGHGRDQVWGPFLSPFCHDFGRFSASQIKENCQRVGLVLSFGSSRLSDEF